MSTVAPVITDWSAGELSELMHGRTDLPAYHKGADTIKNFMVLSQGGVTKRGGTLGMATTYNSGADEARIIPFIYDDSESYVVELTAGYLRMRRNGGVVASTASPSWSLAELWDIQYTQDHNGLYLFHEDYAPMALVRTAQDTFTFGDIVFTYHVGASFTSHNTANVEGDAGFQVTGSLAGMPRKGTFRVKHDTGQYDTYTYRSRTEFVFAELNPKLVRTYDNGDTVIVGHEYHTGGTFVPFGSANNYPRAGGILGGRFVFAGTKNDPQRLWMSEAFGYEIDSGALVVKMLLWDTIITERTETKDVADWADPDVPETEVNTYVRDVTADDHAIDITLASDTNESILWVASGRSLAVGTTSSIWTIPFDVSARTYRALLTARFGTATIQPKFINKGLFFMQPVKKKVREYRFNDDTGDGGAAPADLTLISDHITGATGITQFDYQQDPYSHVYFVRDDGKLAVLTYDKSAGVLAWQRFEAAEGSFISVAIVPESGEDVVYVIMKRSSVYYVCKFIEPLPASQEDGVYMDYAHDVTTDLGSSHTYAPWASETVSLVIDGVHDSDIAADGSGMISLSGKSGTLAYAGLTYEARLRTMPINVKPLRHKRISKVRARLYRTMQIRAGYETWTAADMDEWTAAGNTRENADIEIEFQGDQNTEGCVNLMSDKPLPCTVTALVPELTAPEELQ